MPNISGYTLDTQTKAYLGANNQNVPLLSSFYFGFSDEYVPGQQVPKDNRIQTIEILAGGSFTDLSPTVMPVPGQIANNKISLAYRDKLPTDIDTDRYYYRLEHLLKPVSSASRFRIRANGVRGTHAQQLPPPPSQGIGFNPGYVFVLCGFKLRFTGNNDNQINTIGIYEDARNLTVEFNDRTNADSFDYIVDYAWVSKANQRVVLGEESGPGNYNTRLTDVKGKKLIRGFRFDFKGTDTRLERVGITGFPDGLSIQFGSVGHHAVDPIPLEPYYDYMIRWATINDFVLGTP